MKKFLFNLLLSSIAFTVHFSCSTIQPNRQTPKFWASISRPVEKYRVNYAISFDGRPKKTAYYVFIGISLDTFRIGNKTYRKLIFGQSNTHEIAFVRQDSTGLKYISLEGEGTDKNLDSTSNEQVLFYFDKQQNDNWKVDIGNSYFWKRQIMFEGTMHEGKDDIYVYDLSVDSTHADIGSHITKIYFSRESGVIKFNLQTHWINVQVSRK